MVYGVGGLVVSSAKDFHIQATAMGKPVSLALPCLMYPKSNISI